MRLFLWLYTKGSTVNQALSAVCWNEKRKMECQFSPGENFSLVYFVTKLGCLPNIWARLTQLSVFPKLNTKHEKDV